MPFYTIFFSSCTYLRTYRTRHHIWLALHSSPFFFLPFSPVSSYGLPRTLHASISTSISSLIFYLSFIKHHLIFSDIQSSSFLYRLFLFKLFSVWPYSLHFYNIFLSASFYSFYIYFLFIVGHSSLHYICTFSTILFDIHFLIFYIFLFIFMATGEAGGRTGEHPNEQAGEQAWRA